MWISASTLDAFVARTIENPEWAPKRTITPEQDAARPCAHHHMSAAEELNAHAHCSAPSAH